MKKDLPDKLIERLSRYRQVLAKYQYAESPHINSSDLARLLSVSDENVRRDFMLIGCKSTSNRKGFDVNTIIEKIGEILDDCDTEKTNIAVIGNEQFLKEFLDNNQFFGRLKIAAVFDFKYSEIQKEDETIYYPLTYINEIIKEKQISLAVLNVPSEYVEQFANILVNSGVQGIINYSAVKLKLPERIFVEEVNHITILEKAIYKINRTYNY